MPCTTFSEERLSLLQSDNNIRRDAPKQKDEVPCRHIPARYVVSAMGFLGFFIVFSLRASFSVAVVAMVNSTSSAASEAGGFSNGSVTRGHNGSFTTSTAETTSPTTTSSSNTSSIRTPTTSDTTTTTTITDGGADFAWDETTQGLILGAFFYGYFWPQFLCGQLAHRVGGKLVMGLSILASSLLILLIPLAARAGVVALVFVHALQGFAEAGSFPGMHTMLGVWSPVQERSRLANLTYLGVDLGSVVGMMTSGVLSQYGFAGGWPSIFYIHGTAGCVWALAWMCLVHTSPDHHPRITEREKAFIAETVVHTEKVPTPWREIATSPAVWAIAVIHFVIVFGYTSISAMLPTYMSNILHFDLEQNGFLCSLPFVAQMLVEIVGSVTLDMLHNWKVTRFSRKIFNTVGAVLAAVFFVATGYVPEDSPMLAVTLVTLGVGSGALCVCVVHVSHLDIAPRLGGTLYGVTNTFGNISGFIAPLVAGLLTQNQQTVGQWRIFFDINAGLYLAGALVFLVWGKEEVQRWAHTPSTFSYESISGSSSSGKDEGECSSERM